MIKLAISGAQGRMGTRITALAREDKDFKVAILLESKSHPSVGTQSNGVTIKSDAVALKGADVLIEFTSPEATILHLNECVKNKVKMVRLQLVIH